MYDLIIDGPAYSQCAFTKTDSGYFVTGVETTSSAKINNCYISGFRSPIYAQGNTEITNSVIHGGAFANIYVHNSLTLTLTNVETYQYSQSGVSLGAGIFVDHSSSSATNLTIVANNVKQYNFYTWSNISTLAKNILGADGFTGIAVDIALSTAKSKYKNLLSGSDYHAGIITWNEGKGVTVTTINGYTSGSATLSDTTVGIYGYGKSDGNRLTKVTSYTISTKFLTPRENQPQ